MEELVESCRVKSLFFKSMIVNWLFLNILSVFRAHQVTVVAILLKKENVKMSKFYSMHPVYPTV